MSAFRHPRLAGAAFATLLALAPAAATRADEQQSLEELRNTVINLLQALVDQGVMTRAKAEELVKQAQAKAAETAAQKAKADEGAIRVPFVPQIVKDEITKEVAKEVKPEVVKDVVATAKQEGWGVPAALPDWLSRVRVYGDVTLRGQADLYPRDNPNWQVDPGAAPKDFQSINAAGGLQKAGINEFLNVTDDRYRLRLRARLGVEAKLPSDVTAGIRLSSGSLTDPSSEAPTLGNYAARYTVAIDEAFIRYDPLTDMGFNYFSAVGGRILNPWFAPTELIYARDLTFEGVALTGRLGFGDGTRDQSHAFLTVGALPVQDVPLSNPNSKWLVGAQLGTLLNFGDDQRLKLAVAYYDFLHVSGIQNPPGGQTSTIYNYTAPAFIRYGNTTFDIADHTTDPTVDLFALAARFQLANATIRYEVPIGSYLLAVTGDAVRNVGDSSADMFRRTGQSFAVAAKGWVGDVSFGDPALDHFGAWRATLGYRYVQADAVLDSWTDADFHGGGTNARGYFLWTEFGLSKALYGRLRYLSANEVTGVHYGYDIIQLDLLSHF